MATRPSITVDVRASDPLYTSGDPALVGTATKIARAGTDIAEGYKVDTDDAPQPVFAQEVNFEQNRNDQWVEWVSFGSSANGSDTHIVETDSGGDINVLGVNCADVRVAPAIGVDGIEVTTTGGSKGLEVTQAATSTDYGVYVDATVGAAAPAFVAETVSNVGMLIGHGSLAGLVIGSTANGGVVGPSIDMTANTIGPLNDGVGTIWNQEQNSIENVRMGMGSSAGYPIITKNAPCYARSVKTSHSLTGSVVDQALGSSFGFKTDQVPQDSDEVKVTIWGQMTTQSAQDNTIVLRVIDTDAGDAVMCQLFVYTLEHTTPTTTTIRQSATISDIYQLPAAGARTFQLIWTGDTTGVAATFNGYVEIEQMRG